MPRPSVEGVTPRQRPAAGLCGSQATGQDGTVPGQTNSAFVVHLCYSNRTGEARVGSSLVSKRRVTHPINKSQKDSNLMNQNFLRYQKEDDSLALIAVLFFNENIQCPCGCTQTHLKSPASRGSRLDHQVTL